MITNLSSITDKTTFLQTFFWKFHKRDKKIQCNFKYQWMPERQYKVKKWKDKMNYVACVKPICDDFSSELTRWMDMSKKSQWMNVEITCNTSGLQTILPCQKLFQREGTIVLMWCIETPLLAHVKTVMTKMELKRGMRQSMLLLKHWLG